jgi:hypothetical protein
MQSKPAINGSSDLDKLIATLLAAVYNKEIVMHRKRRMSERSHFKAS